jgi:hypothetical protein
MARVANAKPEETDRYIRGVFEAQSKAWGSPLLNHLVYARRPSIFKGARSMWTGIDALRSLINRRVASLNGCVF